VKNNLTPGPCWPLPVCGKQPGAGAACGNAADNREDWPSIQAHNRACGAPGRGDAGLGTIRQSEPFHLPPQGHAGDAEATRGVGDAPIVGRERFDNALALGVAARLFERCAR